MKLRGYALLLGTDSNCHSTLYGCETNAWGKPLEDFLATYKLRVENQGLKNTFQSSIGQSIIDITPSAKLSVSVMK